MKKKPVIVGCVLLIFLCTVFFFLIGRKPFKKLQSSDIVSAQIKLSPPEEVKQITNMKEFVPYLNNIVVYGKDNSYTEYAGQGVTVTLVLSDGKQVEITECSPFVIIDGVGYKAKHEPCEELNRYANSLID